MMVAMVGEGPSPIHPVQRDCICTGSKCCPALTESGHSPLCDVAYGHKFFTTVAAVKAEFYECSTRGSDKPVNPGEGEAA